MSDELENGKKPFLDRVRDFILIGGFFGAVIYSAIWLGDDESAYANKVLMEMRPQLEEMEGSSVCLWQDGSLAVMGNVECVSRRGGSAFIIERDSDGDILELVPNTPKP